MRASIFCGKFLWLHRARDAADQQALRLPGLEQFERAVDAAGTAGQHDDRVGLLRRRRHRRQQREPGETEHPGQEERSEEHTSELQSLMRISYAVFCLKKKKQCIKNRLETTRLRSEYRFHRPDTPQIDHMLLYHVEDK